MYKKTHMHYGDIGMVVPLQSLILRTVVSRTIMPRHICPQGTSICMPRNKCPTLGMGNIGNVL